MTLILSVLGLLFAGLFGALRYFLAQLDKSRDKVSALELKLSQADLDQAVQEAKDRLKKLEEDK